MCLGYVNIARFAAIGAVVLAIHAEANTLQSLAVAAIAVARALALRLIALRAEHDGLHVVPSPFRRIQKTAPALPQNPVKTIGQRDAPEQATSALQRNTPHRRASSMLMKGDVRYQSDILSLSEAIDDSKRFTLKSGDYKSRSVTSADVTC